MYTRYDQDVAPFLEQARRRRAQKRKQRIDALKKAFVGVFELFRRASSGKRASVRSKGRA